ncbi:MAG: cysteine--tRNA ligase [Patescibacteria group bacterium]
MITLFNTLSGKKEEFKPLKKSEVTMYNCGPTVYNYAHIGNLRAYVFVDILRRTFEYNGYTVKQVMNLTDVGHLTGDSDDGDDKMVRALKREGKPFTLAAMREVADFYSEAFKKDLLALNCEMPHEMPRASDHIAEDIEIVEKLLEKGVAYPTSDGIYFDTSKFPAYGKLGNINLSGQLAGARVAVNSEKKNPADFTLWKKSANDIGWESPWGKGFPGWHIECSGMSRRYLGQPFDVHTGGIDHIPVHHNNEIAQSEAAYDVPLANYWLHNEHLIVASGKMAKSGDNFITLQTLTEKGIDPLAYRYFLLQTHYHSPLNFSWEALEAAQTAYRRLVAQFLKIKKEITSSKESESEAKPQIALLTKNLNNDLDTSSIIASIWSTFENTDFSSVAKIQIVKEIDQMLGLNIENQAKKLWQEIKNIPEEVKKIQSLRDEARTAKDWKKSDELRREIDALGFVVEDMETGSSIRPKM